LSDPLKQSSEGCIVKVAGKESRDQTLLKLLTLSSAISLKRKLINFDINYEKYPNLQG
jgi:hypothetical protein